jgi:transposase-like protein
MTYKKLPESEKQEVFRLYQEAGETIPALSERYGVSTTTIRRIIKTGENGELAPIAALSSSASLPALESMSTLETDRQRQLRDNDPAEKFAIPESPILLKPDRPIPAPRRLQQRSLTHRPPASPTESLPPDSAFSPLVSKPKPLETATESLPQKVSNQPSGSLSDPLPAPQSDPLEDYLPISPGRQGAITDELEPELQDDLDDELDDLDDLDDLEDDGEDEIADEADAEALHLLVSPLAQLHQQVQVLPISEAAVPRTFYLVIDRFAELITRPLKDFGDLGQLPIEETQQRTLPIFDNHRVARRFSNRTQRVIKVPDGELLHRTCSHLQAKGITRLLINGQVYGL